MAQSQLVTEHTCETSRAQSLAGFTLAGVGKAVDSLAIV